MSLRPHRSPQVNQSGFKIMFFYQSRHVVHITCYLFKIYYLIPADLLPVPLWSRPCSACFLCVGVWGCKIQLSQRLGKYQQGECNWPIHLYVPITAQWPDWQVLDLLTARHGQVVRETYREGIVKRWTQDSFSHGAFVMEGVSQKTMLKVRLSISFASAKVWISLLQSRLTWDETPCLAFFGPLSRAFYNSENSLEFRRGGSQGELNESFPEWKAECCLEISCRTRGEDLLCWRIHEQVLQWLGGVRLGVGSQGSHWYLAGGIRETVWRM